MLAKFKVHILLFSLALSALFSATAFAQGTGTTPTNAPSTPVPAPTKIGLINIQEAILSTNEGQKELEALGQRFAPKQTEIQKLSEEIDTLKKKLDPQTKISDEERASLIRTIEGKQKSLQRKYEDAQSEFQQAQQDLGSRIYQKMAGVLEKYASTNGYAVVLDVSAQQSAVLWGNQGTLITKELVDAYNAQSPVAPPAKPAAGGAPPRPSGTAGTTTAAHPPANTGATPKRP
jgi:outer membrane protein